MIPLENGHRPKPTLGSRTRTILCWGGKWPKTRLALLIIDDFLLVAILAMQILEVARLATDGQGVGLLPFTFIPPIIILVSTHIPTPAWSKGGWARPARPHGMAWIGGISFWGLWMIVTIAVKLASYGKVKKLIGEAEYNGVDSKYPYSDRLVSRTSTPLTQGMIAARWLRRMLISGQIDNIVLMCLYWSFLLCYIHQVVLEYIRYEWGVFP